MKDNPKVGVIGLGRWGTNCLRTLLELNVDVTWLCSKSKQTVDKAATSFSFDSAKKTIDYRDVFSAPDVDAVIIATDCSTHFKLAKDALVAGKDVLVEKPAAFTSKDFSELVELAKSKKRIFMVSDIHRFNPGIITLAQDASKGAIGKINYVNITHAGNGPVRSDIGVLWDYFPHSVSIALDIVGKKPLWVSATGASFIKKGIEDVAVMNLGFEGGALLCAMSSWAYPVKKMEVVVSGQKGYAVFDDFSASEKLRYYSKDSSAYSSADLKGVRPLAGQLSHFISCVIKRQPACDLSKELLKVRILEMASESLKSGHVVHL